MYSEKWMDGFVDRYVSGFGNRFWSSSWMRLPGTVTVPPLEALIYNTLLAHPNVQLGPGDLHYLLSGQLTRREQTYNRRKFLVSLREQLKEARLRIAQEGERRINSDLAKMAGGDSARLAEIKKLALRKVRDYAQEVKVKATKAAFWYALRRLEEKGLVELNKEGGASPRPIVDNSDFLAYWREHVTPITPQSLPRVIIAFDLSYPEKPIFLTTKPYTVLMNLGDLRTIFSGLADYERIRKKGRKRPA